jgi:hypothetical protein
MYIGMPTTLVVEKAASSDTRPIEPPPAQTPPREPLDQYFRWLWR